MSLVCCSGGRVGDPSYATELVPDIDRMLVRWLLLVLAGFMFAIAYGQASLFYSNQNQYFLHGMADAGVGQLREDWLASTADPTPIFSGLVAIVARTLPIWTFHLIHRLLLVAYVVALYRIYRRIVGPEKALERSVLFLFLLTLVHSAGIRWLSYRLFGQDYPWYFQAGVAGQYLLGAMLQPSVFGVMLLLAAALFIDGRPWLAAIVIGAGVTMHTTYLLSGAMLTAGFLVQLVREGRWRQALGVGGLTLALVSPVIAYALREFGPTSPETFAQAQDILANVRIPHHCRVDLWLDPIAGLQIAWIAAGIGALWGTRLFLPLAVAFGLGCVLTIAQVATGSNGLALLFPWRISAVLMPVATAAILARLVALPEPFLGSEGVRMSAAVAIVLVALFAPIIVKYRQAFRGNDEEIGLRDHIRATAKPGDVYLLPVRIPDLAATTYGSLSSDFKPPAAKRADARIVPVDLQSFRLTTGAPIFVDFKAIPYRDVDVLEWRRRLDEAAEWRHALEAGRAGEVLPKLRKRGVTHVVEPAALELHDDKLRLEYRDESYQVYRVLP
jgi:uncharacterized protein DUF6798